MSLTPRHLVPLRTVGGILALVGACLGVLAGLAQTLVGPAIPGWSGAKTNTVGLGVLTVALSLVALGCAVALRASHPTPVGRRAAYLAGLVIPAAVCFSTVGRLWWIPGTLLLLAAGGVTIGSDTSGMTAIVRDRWTRVLISVLGSCLLLIAVSAAPVLILLLGVAGGAVLAVAPWLPVRPAWQLALILLATLPFAALTWTSLATPGIALLAVALWFAGRSKPKSGRAPGNKTHARPTAPRVPNTTHRA
ncbi:hypothetical protein V3G39_13655 [Dermatophilaceae bacterium Sec6.4]